VENDEILMPANPLRKNITFVNKLIVERGERDAYIHKEEEEYCNPVKNEEDRRSSNYRDNKLVRIQELKGTCNPD
jgi:hypothetical protein